MRKALFNSLAAVLICGLVFSASAQLSFTSGVDTSAGPNANYPAVQYFNFSNGGGQGSMSAGTGDNLNNGNLAVTWRQAPWNISFSYNPMAGGDYVIVTGRGTYVVGANITAPAVPLTELQVLVGNIGIGDLTLNLTSINSVANGGVFEAYQVVGGTENFAPGTTWSAANGTTLQAYLDDPTLFSSGFTLYGTITLDAAPNSINYGDNLDSLIQFNLTSVPEPSSVIMLVCGTGLLAISQKFKRQK